MDQTCRMHGKCMLIRFLLYNLMGTDHFKDQAVDERAMLKHTLYKYVNWTELSHNRAQWQFLC
jgi:hypothetical protein